MDEPRRHRRNLTTDAFAVLAALSAGSATGSEVQLQVVGDTVGLNIRSSSVYSILHRFEELGLVEENNGSYALTNTGWKRLEFEARMMETIVACVRRRVVDSGRGRW